MRALPDLLDTDPITLSEASALVLRGVVTVSALRAEADRGNLVTMKIGKNLFTTPSAIREMMEKCRVQPVRPASTSGQTIEPGSSATKVGTFELGVLKANVAALRNGSLNTSRKSTRRDQRSEANLVQFPSERS